MKKIGALFVLLCGVAAFAESFVVQKKKPKIKVSALKEEFGTTCVRCTKCIADICEVMGSVQGTMVECATDVLEGAKTVFMQVDKGVWQKRVAHIQRLEKELLRTKNALCEYRKNLCIK